MKREFQSAGTNTGASSADKSADAPAKARPSEAVTEIYNFLFLLAGVKYGVDLYNIHMIDPQYGPDGEVGIGFAGCDGGPEEERYFSEPSDYESMQRMFRDLQDANLQKGVRIDPEKLYIMAKNKMALYHTLVDYFDQKTSPSVFESINIRDKEGNDDVRGLIANLRAAPGENLKRYVNNPAWEAAFRMARERPFISLEHYYVELIRADQVMIPLSLQALKKVIQWEEGIPDTEIRSNSIDFDAFPAFDSIN